MAMVTAMVKLDTVSGPSFVPAALASSFAAADSIRPSILASREAPSRVVEKREEQSLSTDEHRRAPLGEGDSKQGSHENALGSVSSPSYPLGCWERLLPNSG